MAFLETGAGIGLIAPGELAVILGGVAAGQGEIELVPLIALVWVCAVAGDMLSYVLGRRLGRGFLLAHGRHIRLTPERLEQVERYFARHGGKTILFGRFIGWIRALAPFIAGASRMPARRFVPATIAAAGTVGDRLLLARVRVLELDRSGGRSRAAGLARDRRSRRARRRRSVCDQTDAAPPGSGHRALAERRHLGHRRVQ